MTKNTIPYEVTPETAGYIETLRAFEKLKNDFYFALVNQYGENRASAIYEAHQVNFNAIGATISEYLTNSIVSTFSFAGTPVNTV